MLSMIKKITSYIFDINQLFEIYERAGVFPVIIIIGSWIFVLILSLLFLYYLFMYLFRLITGRKNRQDF